MYRDKAAAELADTSATNRRERADQVDKAASLSKRADVLQRIDDSFEKREALDRFARTDRDQREQAASAAIWAATSPKAEDA